MVNMAENIYCISDIWEKFCFPSRLPRTFIVSWMARVTGRDHPLGSPDCTGCHDCDTGAGPGGQHITGCSPGRAQSVTGDPGPRGTSDRSPGTAGDTKPSTSQECKICLKKNNNPKL